MIKGYGPLNMGYLNILNKYKDALLNRLMNMHNVQSAEFLSIAIMFHGQSGTAENTQLATLAV